MANSALTTAILTEAAKLKVEGVGIDKVIPYERNPRKITPEAIRKVAQSIEQFGFNVPIVVDEDGIILAGHTRREAALSLGLKVVPVIYRRGLTEAQKRAWRIADNRVAEESEWDQSKLKLEIEAIEGLDFDIGALGFDLDELEQLDLSVELPVEIPAEPKAKKLASKANGSLAAMFGVPPFSVLDAKQGYWQDRRRWWLETTGMDRMAGRGEAKSFKTHQSDPVTATMAGKGNSTSSFDPVLVELAIRWFCPPGGVVLDPFAGGATAGIVASHLGREYHGVDIRPEQVEGCKAQLSLAKEPQPNWYCGDSLNLDKVVPRTILADLVLTCPPYADLEVYSDNPADLSAMPLPSFLEAYRHIIDLAAQRLKPCRFAVIVVGDARGPDGNYYGLPWRTVEFALSAGLQLYNEAVLLTPPGGVPLRARIPFEASRKLGKTHQNVLVFVKGDAKAATRDIGPCEFGAVPGEEDAPAPKDGDPNAGFTVDSNA